VLLEYLDQYGLAPALRLTSNYHAFARVSTLRLDGTAVANLDVVANQATGDVRASLLWLIDKTRTAFGARLLREWLLHPLQDRLAIQR
jgi:DNA mismatch repair protein MSH3